MELRAEKVSRQFLRKGRGTNIFEAVKEVDLVLAQGTVTVLSGESGSGKSTLLHLLCGLLTPTSGRVVLGDTDLASLPDDALSRLRGEKMGIIPQGQTALHALTVLENILLPASLGRKGEALPEEKERAQQLLERLDIGILAEAMPSELSGGEMRRMAIARALIRNPEVILADEPTGDLDEENTERVLKLLREMADAGAAVLLVTHDAVPDGMADLCLRMKRGELAEVNKSISE